MATSIGKRFQVRLQHVVINGKNVPVTGLIMLQAKSQLKLDAIQLGTKIGFIVQLRKPNGSWFPGAFDWKSHLISKGIYHEGWIQNNHWTIIHEPFGLYRLTNWLRDQLVKTLSDRIHDTKQMGIICLS